MGDYASKGVANAGLTTGIIGTTLSVLNNGGLGNLFGGSTNNKISELMSENAMLKSENYSDKVAKEVYAQSLKDNNALRTEMYAFIKPLAEESAANKVTIATIQAEQKAEIEKNALREQLLKSEIEKQGIAIQAQINCMNGRIGGLQQTVEHITKIVVPKDVVCPEYMLAKNAWVAPTNTPATTN